MADTDAARSADPGRGADYWKGAYEGLGYLGGLILAVMAAAVFLQVVLRFLGKSGIDGLEEVPRYLFIWLIMIGGASAMQRGQHTVLDYFVNLCGVRMRAAFLVLTTGAGLGLFLYLIKLSLTLVPNAQLQTSAGLGLPLGYVYAAVPVGAVLIALPMIRELVAAMRRVWQKPS